jgi:hypothetical protein
MRIANYNMRLLLSLVDFALFAAEMHYTINPELSGTNTDDKNVEEGFINGYPMITNEGILSNYLNVQAASVPKAIQAAVPC